jgi:hypothetical protein
VNVYEEARPLGPGLTQLARSDPIVREVRLPLSPFLGIEALESTDHCCPRRGAIGGVVLIGTQCPGDRLLGGECAVLCRLDDGGDLPDCSALCHLRTIARHVGARRARSILGIGHHRVPGGRCVGYVLDRGRRKIQSGRPVHSPRAANQTAASRQITERELGVYVAPVFGACLDVPSNAGAVSLFGTPERARLRS